MSKVQETQVKPRNLRRSCSETYARVSDILSPDVAFYDASVTQGDRNKSIKQKLAVGIFGRPHKSCANDSSREVVQATTSTRSLKKDELIVGFIPDIVQMFIRERLASRPGPVTRNVTGSLTTTSHSPGMITVPCVGMIADLSGFCSASESLCDKGSEGLDELRTGINKCFSTILNVIRSFGGDILDFAGDALIIGWFVSDTLTGSDVASKNREEKFADVALAAVSCAQKLMMLKLNFAEHNLSLHVGMSFGDLHILIIGGEKNCWRYLFLGPLFKNLCEAVELAKANQIVVAKPLLIMLSQRVKASPIGTRRVSIVPQPPQLQRLGSKSFHMNRGIRALRPETKSATDKSPGPSFFLLESVINTTKAKDFSPMYRNLPQDHLLLLSLLSFVPKVVLGNSDGATGNKSEESENKSIGYTAQLRDVTVIFIKLSGIEIEEATGIYPNLELFQDCLNLVLLTLDRYDGILRQLILDDKGLVMIAAFGVANFTHIDDPTRGLDFALEACAILAPRGVQCFCGVTTGFAYTGLIGDALRHDFAMVGDVVNLSARLMSLAHKLHSNSTPGGTPPSRGRENTNTMEDHPIRGSLTGSVICDDSTRKRSHDKLFTFNIIKNMTIKGKKEQVTVFRVHTSSVCPTKAIQYHVGLETEMKRLQSAMASYSARSHLNKTFSFKSAMEPKGTILLPDIKSETKPNAAKVVPNPDGLVSEAHLPSTSGGSLLCCAHARQGEGKSTFLRAARQQAICNGFLAVTVNLSEDGMTRTFTGIIEILKSLVFRFGQDTKQDMDIILRQCEDTLSPTELSLFNVNSSNVLMVLANSSFGEQLGEPVHPRIEAHTFGILCKLLQVDKLSDITAGKDIFMAIDNIHFLDYFSWVLLGIFLSNPKIRIFICTTVTIPNVRCVDIAKLKEYIERRLHMKISTKFHPLIMQKLIKLKKNYKHAEYSKMCILIEPPGVEILTVMLNSISQTKTLPPDLIKEVIQMSNMNPLIATEIARSLLTFPAESLELLNLRDVLASSSNWNQALHKSYQIRIDSLPVDQQMPVKVASVIHGNFSVKLLQFMMDDAGNKQEIEASRELESILDNLVQQKFLHCIGRERSEQLYGFVNPILKQVAYELLMTKDQVSYHRSLALWYMENTSLELNGSEIFTHLCSAKEYGIASMVAANMLMFLYNRTQYNRVLKYLKHIRAYLDVNKDQEIDNLTLIQTKLRELFATQAMQRQPPRTDISGAVEVDYTLKSVIGRILQSTLILVNQMQHSRRASVPKPTPMTHARTEVVPVVLETYPIPEAEPERPLRRKSHVCVLM